jgi:hypothetical protein
MRIAAMIGLAFVGCVPDRPPADEQPDAAQDAAPDSRMHLRDAGAPLLKSCRDALAAGVTASGIVTIDPDGSGALDVYCDMTTAGGGWMLVWVTGFTDYGNFANYGNAITPRPSWNAPQANTAISTTLPTSPDTPGALEFSQWAKFGSEFLVTSNINQWLDCKPSSGSLVLETQGTIDCQVVKVVAPRCTTTVPNHLYNWGTGPSLNVTVNSNFYYFFDGNAGINWPVHDPCGATQTNQVRGVTNPTTAIYLRPLSL